MYTLKNQISDDKQLAGKLSSDDKEAILAVVKEKTTWLDAHGDSANTEDLEEAKAAVENVANPIMAKLYEQTGGGSDATEEDVYDHTEL
jgi:endoplasmic reticulum chaperone BiP